MNITQFLFQALQKTGLRNTVSIVATKFFRLLTERFVEKSIRTHTATTSSNVAFTPLLPLTQTSASRFIREFPDALPHFLAISKQLSSHNFKIFSHEFLFGEKINWHLDFRSGKEWKKKKYKETGIYDDSAPGDVKFVWELNRHQHFVTLAQVFYLSNKHTYLEELTRQWSHWIEENPFPVGINWASPLEISIRLISWTLTFQFVEAHLEQRNRASIIQSIYQQAAYLATHLSTDKIVRTNHLIGEAAGLFIVASSFGFDDSPQWKKKAHALLEMEIQSQTFSDGVLKEQSSSYHRFVIDFLLLAFLAGKSHSEFSSEFRDKLQKMIEYLQLIQTPEHTLPPYGDCDNGRGFLLAPNLDFWDVRGEIAAGFSLLGNWKKIPPSHFNEETFWLISEEQFNACKASVATEESPSIIILQESGHAIIRSSKHSSTDFCFFRAGEFGLGGNGFCSHSHNDLFSPIIYLSGNPIFTDTGTSVYVGNDIERDYLRSAEAHNSTVIANARASESKRWFGWKKVVNGRIVQTIQTQNEIRVRCGYEESAQVPYTRDIVYLPAKHRFCIEDTFLNGISLFHSYFHLDASITVETKTDHFHFLKNNKPVAQFSFPKELAFSVESGWISKYYGEKISSIILHFIGNVHLKTSFVFTLSLMNT